jgi:iron uptake system component EfeO
MPVVLILAAAALPACSSENQKLLTDAEYETQAVLEVKGFIQQSLDDLAAAAAALQAAAPEPDADGWSASADPAAVESMKAEWRKARWAYESVEGAIAVVFPELDVATDARYDAFIETAPDENLFDDQGVTGVHAIERILWSDSIPLPVLEFESALPNYRPAAFPATSAEADDFKDKLCARLVADARAMQEDFRGLALDAPSAYRGVIGSIREQVEKIDKAATGEEESRYAQYTLADMRANVAAGVDTYAAFQPWLITKGAAGEALDAEVKGGFERLLAGYDEIPGDALPDVPDGWSSENPTPAHLETDFGRLFALVQQESDDATDGALVHEMLESAALLGIEELP